MLHVYRRHNPARCQHTERRWRRCSCPLWVDGALAGTRHHKTLKTRNWDTAQKLAQDLEASGKPPDKRVTLLEACTDFERDAEIGRGLRPSTLKEYKL
jgi:integrase/recombinase XerD